MFQCVLLDLLRATIYRPIKDAKKHAKKAYGFSVRQAKFYRVEKGFCAQCGMKPYDNSQSYKEGVYFRLLPLCVGWVVVVVSRYDDRVHSITHSPTPIVGFFPSSLTLSRRRCIVGSVGESISLAIHHTRTLYYTYRGSLHLRKQRDRYRANWASHWASTLIREMMIFTRHHRPFLPLFI